MKHANPSHLLRAQLTTLKRRLLTGWLCMMVMAAGVSAQVAAPNADATDENGYSQDSPPPSSTLSNFDDITTGWLQCTGPCAGGTNPSSTNQTFNNNPPSLDGGSMMVSLTGPVSCPSPCNTGPNNGWYRNTGVDDSNTSFTLDLHFNIPSTTNVVALEFDQFQYLHAGSGGVTNDTRLYFGTQCVKGSDWEIWNSYTESWVRTGVACSYTVSSTAFNHLVIKVHRVSGDTSCTGGYPCMHYDSITLNGVTKVSGKTTSAGPLPSGWGEQTGFMLQMDGTTSCLSTCTIKEYFDEANFTY